MSMLRRTLPLFSQQQLARINKLVAFQFKCSRREADAYIQQGWVNVDGIKVSTPGARFDPSTVQITLSTDCLAHRQNHERTIILNKPLGYLSCQPERPDQEPAIRLLTSDRYGGRGTQDEDPRRWSGKLAVAGRLDSNSTGLLVFTQSGRVASQILGNDTPDASKKIEKEYLVRVGGPHLLQDNIQRSIQALQEGITDNGQLLRAAKVEVLNREQLRMVLTTGRKHQIRRMLRAVDWHVQAIKRVRIGKWSLGNLQPGQWRFVGKDEPLV